MSLWSQIIFISIHSVDDMRGISEVGEQALEEAKELVEARSKN